MELNSPNKPDPRFKIAHREALIGVALAIINFVWWFGFAYGLGSKPLTEYKFVFGLPAWFFYSCVLGFIVMSVLVIFAVKFWFVDVSLDVKEDDQE